MLAVLFNILHIVIVEHSELGPRFAMGAKEFIQFGVQSLCVAVLGSIDEKRHEPSRQGRYGCPAKSRRFKNKPRQGVGCDHRKRKGVRCRFTNTGQSMANGVKHPKTIARESAGSGWLPQDGLGVFFYGGKEDATPGTHLASTSYL
jgi:hypothetical protein